MSRIKILAVLTVLAALTGCAEAERHKISRPLLAPSPDPQTVFGRATLTSEGDPENPPAGPRVPDRPLTLKECLDIAKEVNPVLDSADQARMGALWNRWSSITNFLPTADASYRATQSKTGNNRPFDFSDPSRYSWEVGLSQPLFVGGANLARLRLARLGVADADIQRTQAREDLNLRVKQTYFGILALEKAQEVARTSVVNLQSHLNVARNFYEVGMAPRNQVLEAEVALAKAVQQANDRDRDVMVSKARLNILLRRPVDALVVVADDLGRNVFPLSLQECLAMGLSDRPELKLGRNAVEKAAKGVDVARSGLYPKAGLTYATRSSGDTWRANGPGSNYANGSHTGWDVAAVASINFWEWGRTKAEIEQSKVDLNRSVNALTGLEDDTRLEVTDNYQRLISAGLNIQVAAKAVESAAEDLRMVRERYLEQVATNTEVLDAQTRYSQAQYDYFTALYDYNLAWATLERVLGRPVQPAVARIYDEAAPPS